MEVTMYGIANCDTIKKAKKWLEAESVAYQFHDYRKQGIDEALLRSFVDALGWEILLNKRGTTYRQLDEADKENIDTEKAISLMLAAPAMIKRPVLKVGEQLHVGFKADQYQTLFK
ncbi:ArsC family reductase [Thaumasiovibrio subtropicus]|uniref:ArsC family reductase n=1 Tax=Thaumasiovibrio subtropicus TaxID=1891207 RepID=UPI000B34FFCE|nr:ArsC family reductase [Thaumasiovibrio subtropicus]